MLAHVSLTTCSNDAADVLRARRFCTRDYVMSRHNASSTFLDTISIQCIHILC